jgi:hypothetical protein
METDTILYVGPSLYGRRPEPWPGELWKGPAAQGDVVRDVLYLEPRQIVLIDGTFNQTLSVWHKELVFALLQGVYCIGAASMGAIRAAELDRYQMKGIGRIYERFRDGEEDDSLVILNYCPETYRPLSTPRVGHEAKAADALEAVEFSRSNTEKAYTTLNKEAITPYLQVIIDRILAE